MRLAKIGSFASSLPLAKNKIHAPLSLTFDLAIKLAERGHQVTYFGSCDQEIISDYSNLKIEDLNYKPLEKSILSNGSTTVTEQLKLIYEQDYLAKILQREDFDLFYSWAGYRLAPLARFCKKPVIITNHDSTNIEKYALMYDGAMADNFFMIYLSEYLKTILPFRNSLGVAFNGVDQNKIKIYEEPENYFSWVGRIVPSKGLHVAIDLAKKHNFNLKIAGPVDSFADFGDSVSIDDNFLD
jgi:glycosyltransferase involved in cell wall biosynthesis